jgi:hypothetical protein
MCKPLHVMTMYSKIIASNNLPGNLSRPLVGGVVLRRNQLNTQILGIFSGFAFFLFLYQGVVQMLAQQFQIRVSEQDRSMFAYVARHFQRTQADTVRTLIRETYEIIKAKEAQQPKSNQEQAAH